VPAQGEAPAVKTTRGGFVVRIPMSIRRLPHLALVIAVVAVAGIAVAVAVAGNRSTDVDFTPQKADQVTNIDVLRQQIANYYGDPTKSGIIGADSNYVREAEGVAKDGANWLSAHAPKSKSKKPTSEKKAIVLDVDDTTLATWNYEIFSNWAYNPVSNGTFVTDQRFPAVPGMVEMVTEAANQGYAIFFLTGRPTSQADATLGNLGADGVGVDAGYPTPEALFTKPAVGSYPDYLNKPEFCGPAITAGKSCATIQYKSGVRAHIENDLGYDIVGNFGDQFSDLLGGFADKTFKLPNPNYYLP
jgi:predicted secreted acid phosphatase